MSMIVPLASGSTGNSVYLELGGKKLLVDMGISFRRTAQALKHLGVSPGELDAVLVTHAHTDHVCGLATAIRYMSAPVYMTEATAERVGLPGVHVFRRGEGILPVPGIDVRSFPTPHDCDGSVGYVIAGAGRTIGYATDLGWMPQHILDVLAGADYLILEANHDVDMLREGPYPAFLKARILSDRGHLSNDAAGEAAAWLRERGTRRFLLAHLSQQNNTPAAALAAVRATLAGTDSEISVAPAEEGEPALL